MMHPVRLVRKGQQPPGVEVLQIVGPIAEQFRKPLIDEDQTMFERFDKHRSRRVLEQLAEQPFVLAQGSGHTAAFNGLSQDQDRP